MADGQDCRVGSGDVPMCLSGVGEGRLQWCSTVDGKRRVSGGIWGMMMDLGCVRGSGDEGDKGCGEDAVKTPKGGKKGERWCSEGGRALDLLPQALPGSGPMLSC